ncbi:MAG: M13 family metallopeptidase [Sphingobacteriales bacterium]|nr:M13 family metallopeptidase [Sphingobacteriales bacterium]
MKAYSILAIVGLSLLISCSGNKTEPKQSNADFLAANIDTGIAPGTDFFLYANNGWFKKNPIPGSEGSNGLWQLIQDTINAQVRDICERSSQDKQSGKGSAKQKIGDLYFSGMDSTGINTAGLTPIRTELDQLGSVNDPTSLAAGVALVHMNSGAPLFDFYVGQDDKISSKHAVFLRQGGLGLPDRSFYLESDERSKSIRSDYVRYLQDMLSVIGYDSLRSKGLAADILALETKLAKASRSIEDTRDPQRNYNKMPLARFEKEVSAFNWNTFLSGIGLRQPDTVIIGQPEFFSACNKLIRETAMPVWGAYLQVHFIRGLAPYLDDNTYSRHFRFYSTTMRGITEMKPRWKRVVDQTNGSLGELIGQVYVTEYLPKGTKEKLLQIGEAANRWSMSYMIGKFGKPVDRTEWDMYPQTYNAYYNPSNNEIVVPGCNIIVPGYERVMADDAILYSIIGGSTFGHEITHGFDDQGAQYDANGNLSNWWTREDSIRFAARTQRVVEQYNQYRVVDSLHINGEMTLGENIADIGGILMGYEAFRKTEQYTSGKSIAGLSPDKRFFLGYALAWMINTREELLVERVRSDVHSPPQFRVNGPLANMKAFHQTFGIKPGDAMFRPDSLLVEIW